MTLAKVEPEYDWNVGETCDEEVGVWKDKLLELKSRRDFVGDATIGSRSAVKVGDDDVCSELSRLERESLDEGGIDVRMGRSEVDEG